MFLRRIEAPTMADALSRVERECGAGALLVETRRTAKGFLVVAAQAPVMRPASARRAGAAAFTPGFTALAERALAFGLSATVLRAVEDAMLGTKVNLTRAGDPAVAGIAARILKALIKVEDSSAPAFRVTALLGPTGVGKTTTLAKLAARAQREHGESVAIVTVDTYRVAAVEQLRAYADMLAAPFEVAFTPLDLKRALRRFAGVDRVFIDTSGRGPFDQQALAQTRGTLEGARPACLLCLPAGMRRVDAEASVAAFEPLGLDALALTKWDETKVPGETLSLCIEQGLPLAHVTVGQEVPADIVSADAGALAASALRLPEAQAEAVLA
jgi:flagellar biosynthesis protein FlhF